MVTRFTSLDVIYRLNQEKLGLVVFLSLPITTEHMCLCVRHMSIADIGRAEGLKLITDKVDEIYL